VSYQQFETVAACDLCGATSFRPVDRSADVVQCRACSFRFVTPRPTQQEIARAYSAPGQYDAWIAVDEARRRLWQRRWVRIRDRRGPGRLLDIGAGLGTFLDFARRDGWQVEGTEVSETAIAYAHDRYDITLRRGQVDDLDLPAGGYDVVTLWHVIEHVPSPGSTLAACRRLLAPGGLLVMAMPNDGAAAHALSIPRRALARIRRRPNSRYARLVPGAESHLSHFTPGSLRRRLEASGFVVDELGVDDARPVRGRLGTILFRGRTFLTAVTPWNFGFEMFVVAHANAGDGD
jgi:2-polyprenyl-3-methyl-5-hydroxy-6-metoxy-1,4-benzoquinol methylase